MSDSRYYSIKRLTRIPSKITQGGKTVQFLLCITVAAILVFFFRDENFLKTQDYVLFLLFFSIGLWVTEAIPPFAVGILIIGFLVFFMGREETIDIHPYVQTWSDGVIFLFLGGFFLAEGMKKTNLDLLLLRRAAPKFGNQAKNILLGLMMTTAITSMLMSNTATTAMMIATISPLIQELGNRSQITKAFLLGIPTAAAVGGMGTIIGSAPNAIAVGALEGIGIKISFMEWMLIGTPLALLLTYIFWRLLITKYKITHEVLSMQFLNNAENTVSPDETRHLLRQRKIVFSVLSITLIVWLTSQWTGIPVAAGAGIPIVMLTMMGIIDADNVRTLPWDTLMLVAGGLALGLAIQEQGLATYFISKIDSFQINFYLLALLFAITTVTLSNFMSNTAATTILIPVAISLLSISTETNPVILPVIIGLSASCAILLPVSTPPNAIAFSTGLLNQSEFRMGGFTIGLAGPILIILWTFLIVSLFH